MQVVSWADVFSFSYRQSSRNRQDNVLNAVASETSHSVGPGVWETCRRQVLTELFTATLTPLRLSKVNVFIINLVLMMF